MSCIGFFSKQQIVLLSVLSILFVFFFSESLAQDDGEVEVSYLSQVDSRINVRMFHRKSNSIGGGGFNQTFRIVVKNNTNDKLFVKLEFYAELVCGKTVGTNIGGKTNEGLTFKPYEERGNKFGVDGIATAYMILGVCKDSELRKVETSQNQYQQYTAISRLNYRLISIENLSEKEKAENQKRELEQNKLQEDKEKKLQEENEQKLSNRQQVANVTQHTNHSSNSNNDKNNKPNSDDFWNDNNSSTSSDMEKNAKPAVSSDEIKKKVEIEVESRRIEQQNQVDKLVGKTTGLVQSFYQIQAAGNAYNNMKALSSLNGRYSSIEELERDFVQQSNMIRQEANNFTQNRKQALNDYLDLQADTPQEQAYGEVLKSVGNIIVQAQADKAEREAREELRRQREKIQEQINAENLRAKYQLRTKLCQAFVAGGTPIASHHIQEPVVYMFAYIVDSSTFNKESASVWLSEVFPVYKYSDNTFPYKNSLTNRFRDVAAGEVVLVGFYTEEKKALEMYQSFIRLAAISEFTVVPFKTGISKVENNKGDKIVDFWGNPDKEQKLNPNNQNSNFWNE